MSARYSVNITKARIAQHAPSRGQGREAALLDIAQDLILRELHDEGLLDLLVFKGPFGVDRDSCCRSR